MSGKLQKGNKDIYYHEWLKRLIRREAVISQILGLTTSDSDPSLWTQELQEYYNNMNNGLSFDFQNLINALQQLEGASTIPLSNTVWVNLDLTASDTNSRRFKTYEEAITWINANGGTLSFTNMWQVNCPPYMENITLYDYIIVNCNIVGTVINELTLSVYYVYANVNQISVIQTLDLNGKNLFLNDCLIDEIAGTGYLRLEDCYVNDNDVISGLTINSKRTYLNVVVKDGGVLFTKNCTGSVEVENGGTWNNQGETIDARDFDKVLDNAVTNTQKLARHINEHETIEQTVSEQLVRGTGTITLTEIADGDTITINTEVFTFHDVLPEPATNFDILIGADDNETFINLLQAINDFSEFVSAGINGDVMSITANVGGEDSNYIFETTATGLTLSPNTGFLEGGTTLFVLKDKYSYKLIEADTDIILPETFAREFVLRLRQDVDGGHVVTFSSTLPIKFAGGIPFVLTTTGLAVDIVRLYTNGTEWYITNVVQDL